MTTRESRSDGSTTSAGLVASRTVSRLTRSAWATIHAAKSRCGNSTTWSTGGSTPPTSGLVCTRLTGPDPLGTTRSTYGRAASVSSRRRGSLIGISGPWRALTAADEVTSPYCERHAVNVAVTIAVLTRTCSMAVLSR